MQIGTRIQHTIRRTVTAVAIAAVTLCGLSATATAQSGEMKPVAVIAATSYDHLLTDLDYLGQFGGQVKAGQQLNNMLLLFTQNKGLEGLDKSKPWGAIVQTDGFQFVPVVCLPVTDLDSLLALVGVFGMTTSDVGDGITEIEVPNQSVYVKKAGNWAFVARQAEMLANTPANPSALFADLTSEYDLAARVMVQNVPEMYRSIAVEQMRAGAQAGLEKQANETDEAFTARREMTEANIEQIVKAINEIDEIAVGFTADSENGGANLDFIYSGIPGTNFAKSIEAYASAKTMFAGCMRDGAAMRFNMAVTTPPELLGEYQGQMKAQFDSIRQQVMSAIEKEAQLPNEEARQTVKSAVGDLLDAAQATAATGKMDIAGHVFMDSSTISFVAGGFTKDPSKIESALKKLSALVEGDPNFSGVNWNADSHAGSAIHTMQIPVPDFEDEIQRIVGKNTELAIAISKDAVFVTAGTDSLPAIKKAISSSQSGSLLDVKPVEFSISLLPLIQTGAELDQTGNAVLKAMLEALITKSEGMDKVRMTAEAVDGKLRARLELEKGVLEAVGAAAMSARRQGAAAGF